MTLLKKLRHAAWAEADRALAAVAAAQFGVVTLRQLRHAGSDVGAIHARVEPRGGSSGSGAASTHSATASCGPRVGSSVLSLRVAPARS